MADCHLVSFVITLLPAGRWGAALKRVTEAAECRNWIASADAAHTLAATRQYAVFSCQGS
jgi:hypothetical protein